MWPFTKREIVYSKRRYSDYLPVGTIVKLYNDDKEYMIFRYLGNSCISFKSNNKSLSKSRIYSKERENKVYKVDYSLLPYPIGFMLDEINIMHDDIEEVIFLGYDDEYRKNVLNDVDKWNEKGE